MQFAGEREEAVLVERRMVGRGRGGRQDNRERETEEVRGLDGEGM